MKKKLSTRQLMKIAKSKMTESQLKKIGCTNTGNEDEQEAYLYKLYSELTIEQAALWGDMIYHHPSHFEYFASYRMGEYDHCFEYAMKHKDSVTVKNLPKEERKKARRLIESWIELTSNDKELVTLTI